MNEDRRKHIRQLSEPAFLICVFILAVSGLGKGFAVHWVGVKLSKEAIPLRRSLDLLDEPQSQLGPYKVLRKNKIDNPDMLESLGTEDYIEWGFEDTEADEKSPVRYCSLFVTYYTGNPDQVPHVPEECYIGSGKKQSSSETIVLNLSQNGNVNLSQEKPTTKLAVKYLVFESVQVKMFGNSPKYPVIYFFKVNDEYANSRGQARKILGSNLLGKYSYFSKVECWNFHGRNGNIRVEPSREDVIKACEKFLTHMLPVLEERHWPDWEAANKKK